MSRFLGQAVAVATSMAAAAQDVRRVLQHDQATRNAKVQVDRGLVTLHGPSTSPHERQLLVASAARVKGVNDPGSARGVRRVSPQEQRAAVADAGGAGALHVVDHLRIAGGS